MKVIRLGAAALNQTPMDWEGNFNNIKEAVLTASTEQVDILCLPELCVTGYGCEDQFFSEDLQSRARSLVAKLLHDPALNTLDVIYTVGLPIPHNGFLYNCCMLIHKDKILSVVTKQYLAGDGIHYEQRWFKSGQHFFTKGNDCISFPEWDTVKYLTIGSGFITTVAGLNIGFEICEDAWVANRPGITLAEEGVDLILNPSASHFSFGKQKLREDLVKYASRVFNCAYVYSNLLGCESGRAIYDGACIIANNGEVVAKNNRFSYKSTNLVTADVDVSINRLNRSKTTSTRNSTVTGILDISRVEEVTGIDLIYKEICQIPTNFQLVPAWEELKNPQLKYYEFTHAVALGLFDYLRKSKTNGFVLSLSGGADSSSVAILVSEMVKLGISELGSEQFTEKLRHCSIPTIKSERFGGNRAAIRNFILKSLLTCIYQKTENSSQETENLAKDLCLDLGAKYHVIDIQNIVDQYTSLIQNTVDHKLSWETDNITLQNIQARVRGPSVWMVANIEQKLLLTTGNRSEIAVGYTTMDGDTCGSLNPIGGIDKDFLLSWLSYISSVNNVYKTASVISNNKPTAELKPLSEGQSDEKDLMPYKLLNEIEKLAIRDKRSPMEIYAIKESDLIDLTNDVNYNEKAKELINNIKKFFCLWSKNQWKRERYAPSFHLDDESLDPKTWCRFPILCGNFEDELKELDIILNEL